MSDILWHTKTSEEVLEHLHSHEDGLSNDEAKKRLAEYGSNKLPEAKTDSYLVIFLRQFKSPLIYILCVASIIVFLLGEKVDGLIILAVLFFNAVVGTIQEGRAQNTLSALKRLVGTKAVVLRDYYENVIDDTEIVPGDILMLREGEKVPADARIIISQNLQIDEAVLTGESVPVFKISALSEKRDCAVSEQKNMVFKGTYVVGGNGKAVVVRTGLKTVVGAIAAHIATISTEIPLRANIRYLSHLIIAVVASISVLLFAVGILLGNSVRIMFATVVSLAVSIIPEGLPIVMTLVLATGVWRMSKRNALVKKLQAVEALGQARVIAVDKTGTITKNELVVQRLYANGKLFEIGGVGYEPKGDILFRNEVIEPLNYPELLLAGKLAAFSANAHVIFSEADQLWHVTGDPTEAAMKIFAEKIGFRMDELEHESPRLAEIPFDYKTKYHATLHAIYDKRYIVVAGAPEVVLAASEAIWQDGMSVTLSSREKEKLDTYLMQMLRDGMRVVALAMRETTSNSLSSNSIKALTFFGFFAMKDALRPEVAEAMQKAAAAGIRVVMITGDHVVTAEAIAKDAGIFKKGDDILTGRDVEMYTESELSKKLGKVSLFARVTPEHKLKIIRAYQRRGEIIAMTGDGVNDAPSLVAADLGVAMGKIGTEVAKTAADIVLLDDNFGSIVSAVEEGRSIYKTIKKVILYLFSTSWGETITIIGALCLGYPLPIVPVQIIWLNFVTDGFLDVALAMEPKESGLLKGTFERPKKYLIDSLMVLRMVLMAFCMALGTLYLFRDYADFTKASTIALTALAVFQWLNAWNCRSEDRSVFQMSPFSNKFLVGATGIVIFLQINAVYNPVFQKILHTASLTLVDWVIIIAVATSIVWVEEIRKVFYRRRIV